MADLRKTVEPHECEDEPISSRIGFARRSLEDLTLMDDYMFGAVMQDPRLLKPLIEFILDIRIKRIEYIEPQKTLKESYASKGIRLDLYVEDERGVVYNVEVQTTKNRFLPRRIRYYQSVVDVDILRPGADYKELKDSFVIFICNHDPFGQNRAIYRFENRCVDQPELALSDGAVKVIVNTRGNLTEVPDSLREVIRYLNDGTVSGEYSRELDDAVQGVRANEGRRMEYMLWQLREQEIRYQCMEEGRKEGMAQGMAQGKEEIYVSNIRSLMEGLSLSARQAMNLLKIPSDEQGRYLELLGTPAN